MSTGRRCAWRAREAQRSYPLLRCSSDVAIVLCGLIMTGCSLPTVCRRPRYQAARMGNRERTEGAINSKYIARFRILMALRMARGLQPRLPARNRALQLEGSL